MPTPKPTPTERIRLLDEAAQKFVQARILLRDAGASSVVLEYVGDAMEWIGLEIKEAKQDAKEIQ